MLYLELVFDAVLRVSLGLFALPFLLLLVVLALLDG